VRRGEIAAGIFAAKEAVAKALGTGFDGFGPGDIEILPDAKGRPVCRLMGGALAATGGGRMHVSVTHEGGMAAATAIWEGEMEG
jgi:holo-[acyl-carrier protein] synthase